MSISPVPWAGGSQCQNNTALTAKAAESDPDPYLALLYHRTAPAKTGLSPANSLFTRTVRIRIPALLDVTEGLQMYKETNKAKQSTPCRCHNLMKMTLCISMVGKNGHKEQRGRKRLSVLTCGCHLSCRGEATSCPNPRGAGPSGPESAVLCESARQGASTAY